METKVSKETAHHCQMQGSDRRSLGAVTDLGIRDYLRCRANTGEYVLYANVETVLTLRVKIPGQRKQRTD